MFSNWQQFGLHLALSTHENRRYNLLPHPMWARRWLLFQEDNREQYSDTTDSRPIHHRQSIATYRPRNRPSADRHIYRPICRPTVGRLFDGVSADVTTAISVGTRSTCRPTARRHIGREWRPREIFITHDPNHEQI